MNKKGKYEFKIEKSFLVAALSVFWCHVFFSANLVSAAVIFETDFNSNSNWNTNRENDSSTSDYYECGRVGFDANTCRGGDYPANWEAFRSACNLCANGYPNTHPKASIQPLPGGVADHSGSSSGKALIIYSESDPINPSAPWPGDGNLAKHFGSATHPELYIRLWTKVQPGWQWAVNGNSGGMADPTLKFFRVGYDAGGENLYSMSSHHPWMIFDWMNFYPSTNGFSISYRCDPADYYCEAFGPASPNRYQGDTVPIPAGYEFSDGGWHVLDYHLKLNNPGVSNGILEISMDGHSIYAKTNVQWLESGSTVPGFNVVMFGGNSVNPFVNKGEQWYAVDDIAISTTPLTAGSDTISPFSPTGLSVR